tara:strand:+ start:541 stop:1122 length:582 start_codon:yes stop_codon:yes gene_type:complete
MTPLTETQEACKDKLLNMLARDAYRFGDFSLSSGRKSKHYVNCKPVTLSGLGLSLLSIALLDNVEENSLAVAGLTLGADPLVSAVAMKAAQINRHLDALIVRKEAKGHGTGAWLEGPLPPKGSLITVLEDVVTTGGSSLKAVTQLREAGFLVKRIVTIVDRQEGGEIALKDCGLELISLFQLKDVALKAKSIL